MTKLSVILPTGEKVDAEIVRYFDAYGKKYLVYTLNEKDEQGFVKLYVAKVNGTPKALVGEFIEDDNEWSVLKSEFKKIIGENGDSGRTSANDMNPAELENVNVRGHRIIKLMESYVNLLGANKKEFAPEVAQNGMMPDFSAASMYNAPQETTPFVAPIQNFPEPPSYQASVAPSYPEMPTYNPEPPKAMTQPEAFGYQSQPTSIYPSMPDYNQPMQNPMPMPEEKAFVAPIPEVNKAVPNVNYEEMYNEVKAKLERCTAELEKVTNENIDLRIKIDDIREILNGN